MLDKKIKAIYPNIDLLNDCVLMDEGDGAYIAEWNYPQPQPTQAQLDAVTTQAQALENSS